MLVRQPVAQSDRGDVARQARRVPRNVSPSIIPYLFSGDRSIASPLLPDVELCPASCSTASRRAAGRQRPVRVGGDIQRGRGANFNGAEREVIVRGEAQVWATNTNEDRPLPPLLAHLIEATKAAGESKHAAAIRELGHLAVAYVPGRDIVTGAVHVTPIARRTDVFARSRRVILDWRSSNGDSGTRSDRLNWKAQRDAVEATLDDVTRR